MVKINKLAEPNILTLNKVNWTTDLLGFINRNEKVPPSISSRYNQDDIKKTLRDECNNKCMYCESTIAHVSYEHIEHIKPKAKTKFPELTYEWTNLGLSCPICNMNKGDEYDLKVDVWSLGVIVYAMLCGNLPFNGKDNEQIRDSILESEVKFDK